MFYASNVPLNFVKTQNNPKKDRTNEVQYNK